MQPQDTVLIVDDSLTVRMDLAEAFHSAGFQTLLSASVAEAHEILSRDPIDIIVLDVLLPDGDGVALLKEIRTASLSATAVVLMLSAEAEVKDRIRGLQTGADEYVGKPYDAGYVVARSQELLRARRSSSDGPTTVLLIDDSTTFREELKTALEDSGFAVLTAPTGEDGLRIAVDRRPNALIVDGVLPGVDGGTVIRRIRLDAALRGIPCLMLTGSEDKNAELRALDAGADAFVRKEEDISFILAKLAAVLRRASTAVEKKDTSSVLGPKKILAIDDSETYLQQLTETLRGEGYDVVLARSGEGALELLAVQTVDCILLDLLMPGMGGQETCRRIKAAPVIRDVPLIMLTALDDRETMIQGLSAGADDYISKSSEFDVLKARVRAQIRRKQFQDESRKIREELLQMELEIAEARTAREVAETRAALAEELELKNKELEAFSYSVSHDLRAPLRRIDGFCEALFSEYYEKLDEKGQGYLNRVRFSTRRMSELIDDLLQLSRINRTPFQKEKVNLSQLAELVMTEIQRQDADRDVNVLISKNLVVEADGRLMKIVLENLLGNAWKFTSKSPQAKIEFGLSREENNTIYFIRDNGAGFDMTYVEKIFTPFQRLHHETEFPGTGIGLATVHRIMERQGGRVWAESCVGCGATFFFAFSRKKVSRPLAS